MIIDTYLNGISKTLSKIADTQRSKILSAAKMVCEVIKNDGIIYIFGCGHSHLIGLDCFYRAGGLANVSAMLDTDLMLHNGAAKSSKMEKMSGIAESIFERYCITKKDLIIIVSTSGKNSVPVEMAKVASKNRIKNIGIISSAYFGDAEDMLYKNCDLYIDNCVTHGDAFIDISNSEAKMGSLSTAASSYAVQVILMEGAEMASKEGVRVPVYMSGNVDGGAEFNKTLIKEYMPRVKHL